MRGSTVAALVMLAATAAAAETQEAAMSPPAVAPFGTLPDGREARLYTLEVPGGWKATLTDYGAILTSFLVPPRDGAAGEPVDVVLGFDAFDGYLKGHPYFGSTCGRCSNRIAGGRFELDGKTYALATNNGPNHLHGGVEGFDKRLWKATPRTTDRGRERVARRLEPCQRQHLRQAGAHPELRARHQPRDARGERRAHGAGEPP